ncbi:mediator complex, subunit Med18 [Cladorrhinum sp. PSN332]|nr:mediator complex, subunit Med18 [Cladorrhinum sp. PSN332]
MHDIFLTAVIQDEDVLKARAILAGVTKSQEYHLFMRIQHFEPKDQSVKGLPLIKELTKERNNHTPNWLELNSILLKQAYTLQIRTKVNKDEIEAAKNGGAPLIPPTRVRVLKWCEMPDPPSQHLPPWISQRRALDIYDPQMEKILVDNRFQRTSNIYEESYEYRKGKLVYSLTKTWPVDPSVPSDQVPNLASQENFAPFWMLYVRSLVESKAEAMQQAHASLAQVKGDLAGVFVFKSFDRRAMDTRCHVPA